MSKKNKKNKSGNAPAAPEVTTELQTETVEVSSITEPVSEPAAPGVAPTATVTADPLVYARTDREPALIRKGFEAALFAEISRGPGTAEQLVTRLLDSGEFQRVAPKAAELRPSKPTTFLLNKWVRGGLLTATPLSAIPAVTTEVIEEPAVIEDEPAVIESATEPVEASV